MLQPLIVLGGVKVGLIERKTSIGTLYASNKTGRMALEINDEVISDQDEVIKILNDNRIPFKIEFEITEKCNFDCYYCFAKSLRNRKDLSTEEMKKIIDELERIGIIFLDITGGEPMARKDFLEILRYINDKGFIVRLITNGSWLNDEIIKELQRGHTETIRLSLLAPTEEVCDKLTRVKGSFKKTIEAAKMLKESDLNFYISSVITRENVKLYNEYDALERELGMLISYELDVGPTFTGYSDVKEYGLTKEDLEDIRQFGKTRNYVNGSEKLCDAGRSKFCVDNQGNLLPCMKIRKEMGNLLTESFEDIWEGEKLKKVITKQLTRNPKCLKCEKHEHCPAFCPAMHDLYDDEKTRCRSASIMHTLLTCR
jgi:radical SAM protein with 4Fe4S-binding SPASM domain